MRLATLAEFLHSRRDPWRGFALIRAYFDDAGTHAGSEVTSIGGLLGTTDAWTALEADWEAVIADFREYGLTAFHAYDCEVGINEFSGFRVEVRRAISRRFARVVAKHTDLRVFWSSCINSAWAEVTDDAFRQRYGDPFGLCFEWCLQQTARWSVNYAEGAPVSLMFSEQSNYRDRCNDIFRYYEGAKRYLPLKTLTFGSYRDFAALQAADFVATEINRHWRAAELDPNSLAERRELDELRKGHELQLGGCYDRRGLANAVRQYNESSNAYAADVAAGKAPPENAYTEGWSVGLLRSSEAFVLNPPTRAAVHRHGDQVPETPEPAHSVRLRCL